MHPSPALLFLSCSILSLTSCTFLPSAGPSGHKIKAQAGRPTGDPSYPLLPINDEVLDAIRQYSKGTPYLASAGRRSDAMFGARGLENLSRPGSPTIALGDVISVAIYETDSALFGPSLASGSIAVSPMTALPPQNVDRSGEISIPFLGRVRVLGRSTGEVESEIREGLRMKTADPQVVVTVAEHKGGDLVSVAGDVKSPARIPVSLAGTKVIDAIASAGGSLSAPYDTMVSLTRGRTTRSDTLQEVYNEPSKNIELQPGDTILLRRRALSFMTFGATGKVGNFPITVEDLSLSDAVAASGGPDDMEANPATIFIYREEPISMLQALGKTNLPGTGTVSPVIYQLDLHDPKGFFYAKNFNVRDRDLIYYAPAGSAGLLKFMRLVNTLLAPAMSGVGVAGSAKVLGTP